MAATGIDRTRESVHHSQYAHPGAGPTAEHDRRNARQHRLEHRLYKIVQRATYIVYIHNTTHAYIQPSIHLSTCDHARARYVNIIFRKGETYKITARAKSTRAPVLAVLVRAHRSRLHTTHICNIYILYLYVCIYIL